MRPEQRGDACLEIAVHHEQVGVVTGRQTALRGADSAGLSCMGGGSGQCLGHAEIRVHRTPLRPRKRHQVSLGASRNYGEGVQRRAHPHRAVFVKMSGNVEDACGDLTELLEVDGRRCVDCGRNCPAARLVF